MKKNLTHKIRLQFFVLFFIFSGVNLKSVEGQMVYMPDAGLRLYLSYWGCGSCITGDSINSSCPSVISTHRLILNRDYQNNPTINDLQGIQVFANLDTLTVRNQPLSNIPPLPNSLIYLDCSGNSLTNLPALPTSLIYFDCSQNIFTTLPFLRNDNRIIFRKINRIII